MRGFLRRTLQSARGAEEQRLKPLTGSVYAGDHRRQEILSGFMREETINAMPGPSALPDSNQHPQGGVSQATPTSAPAPLLPVGSDSREWRAGGHANISERQRPSSVVDSSVASSAAPRDRESAIRPASHSGALHAPVPLLPPLHPVNVPLLSNLQRNEGSRAEATATEAPREIPRSGKLQQQEELRPASSAPQQKVVRQKVEPLLRPAMAARPPSAGPQLSLPKNRPPQEPEIQVHIGRIEVIAAVPQPPRVPTPRPSRATSLADYLAGRNGRS
jgi:hypothetical protein